jgi:hypothetical protein
MQNFQIKEIKNKLTQCQVEIDYEQNKKLKRNRDERKQLVATTENKIIKLLYEIVE